MSYLYYLDFNPIKKLLLTLHIGGVNTVYLKGSRQKSEKVHLDNLEIVITKVEYELDLAEIVLKDYDKLMVSLCIDALPHDLREWKMVYITIPLLKGSLPLKELSNLELVETLVTKMICPSFKIPVQIQPGTRPRFRTGEITPCGPDRPPFVTCNNMSPQNLVKTYPQILEFMELGFLKVRRVPFLLASAYCSHTPKNLTFLKR